MPSTNAAQKPATGTATKPPAHAKLSPAHKQALAEGRAMSAIIDRYLFAINTPHRRGRPVSKETLQARVYAARARYKSATGVAKLLAAQEVRDLQIRLAAMSGTTPTDLQHLETAFVKIAKRFGDNHGIDYHAWREAGVPATVLKKAGIARTRDASTSEPRRVLRRASWP
jgi:hypothetical protein